MVLRTYVYSNIQKDKYEYIRIFVNFYFWLYELEKYILQNYL